MFVGAVAAATGTTALALGVGGYEGLPAPLSPQGAVAAYFASALHGDGDAHWDLMCRDEQRRVGPRQEYLRSIDRIAAADPDDLFHPRITGVHPADPAERAGVEVDLVMESPDGSGWGDSLLVVWEDGGFRVCGTV